MFFTVTSSAVESSGLSVCRFMNPLCDAALCRSTPIHHTPDSYTKRELVGAGPLHLAYARPFGRLKAPLGLSLLHSTAQTRTFENTLISAACKKTQGKPWQKERGPDGASPLDMTKAHSFAVCIGFSIRFVELTIFKQNSNACQMLH